MLEKVASPVRCRTTIPELAEISTSYIGYTLYKDESLCEVKDGESFKSWLKHRFGINEIDYRKINIFNYQYPDNKAGKHGSWYVLTYGKVDKFKRAESKPEKNLYIIIPIELVPIINLLKGFNTKPIDIFPAYVWIILCLILIIGINILNYILL